MIESQELKQEHWLTWPLLESVREYHRNLSMGVDAAEESAVVLPRHDTHDGGTTIEHP